MVSLDRPRSDTERRRDMALKVAAALYSVRDEMAKDPFAAVKSVSDLG